MSKFINPFTDVGFKRIFGQEFSKPVLLAFLNSLLEGERVIVNLKLLDKEQIGLAEGDKSLIYDVYCETDTGEYIIVEMQYKSHIRFKERCLFYTAYSIARQGEPGKFWKYNIRAVYLVALLNFKTPSVSEEFRTDVALMDMQHHRQFSDKLRMIFLQMPYFTKEAEECETIFEKIIYTLKHMDILQRMPWMAQNAVFQRLAEIADVASLSKEERMRYDEYLRAYRDTIVVMEGQYQEGMEKGMENGMEKGMLAAKLDNARKMKADGMADELISKYTGLPLEEIANI